MGVTSRGFEVLNEKDLIANQRAFEVDEAMWVEGVRGAAGANSMWERGSEELHEAFVEDGNTITKWGFVDRDVALHKDMVRI